MSTFLASELEVPWTESPFFESLLSDSHLDAQDHALIERFARDGVLVFDPEVPTELLDEVLASTHRAYPGLPAHEVTRVQDAWHKAPDVGRLAEWPRILEVLELLYRRTPLPFQTLNFERGTEQRTHADSIHFQSHPANWMAGVWVALEDIDAGNGPLHYVPGSHTWPVYGPDQLGLESDFATAYPVYEDFVEALIDARQARREVLQVPLGHAVVWAANVLHGGSPIQDTGRTRRSQVTHYYFDGCTYYTPMTSELFLGRVHFRTSDLIDIRTGRPIPHQYKGHAFAPVPAPFQPVAPPRRGGTSGSLTVPPSAQMSSLLRRAARAGRQRMLARRDGRR